MRMRGIAARLPAKVKVTVDEPPGLFDALRGEKGNQRLLP